MRQRRIVRTAGVATAIAALLLVTACSSKGDSTSAGSGGSSASSGSGGSSSSASSSGTTDPLGPMNPATGTPVKVGMINDGTSEGINNDINNTVGQATVKWLNERMKGLGGHPIELDLCVTNNDPGKASDCANQMVTDQVAAVVVPASAQAEAMWPVLQSAGIPTLFYGTGSAAVLADTKTGYSLSGPGQLLVDFPAGLAKAKSATNVTAVVIDVPAALDFYKGGTPAAFAKQGLKLDV